MKRLLTILTLLGVLCTFAGMASADTITYNSTVNIPTGTTTELNANVSAPKWDTTLFALLNLTSVQWTLNGSLFGTITLVNNTPTSQTANGETTSTFTGKDPNNHTASFLFDLTTPTATLAASGGTKVDNVSGSLSSTSALFSGADLAAFEQAGGGSWNLLVTTLTTGHSNGGGGNILFGQQTSGGATLTVTYTYGSSVPEPATFFLTGGALLAVSAILRRRKSA